MSGPVLVWLRRDLRLSDHPALDAAARRGPVIPVFIHDPDGDGAWAPGAASRWWLRHSLASLGQALARRGSRLILRRGDSLRALSDLARETGASAVHFSRRYEPAAAARDARVSEALRNAGVTLARHGSALLFEPEALRTGSGGPYRVFTPFWNALQAAPAPAPPLPVPRLNAPEAWPDSLDLDGLGLSPDPDGAAGMRAAWNPGWEGARALMEDHLPGALARYAADRDRPDRDGTARLSPHLHFGEIGPREAWAAAGGFRDSAAAPGHGTPEGPGPSAWRRQLAWREFAHHLLAHFPRTAEAPLRPAFAAFPWAASEAHLSAWRRGRTGYPLVDAGMRQLGSIGWMHNRVRMTAASFLVKHLLLPWQEGARAFWDMLVDADLAQNTLGWQWVAGCGADAAPYFRVFNPVAQGVKCDPDGAYVRRWVPELARLPARWIHRPWEAPAAVLSDAGVALGKDYPRPVVGHAAARARALAAYGSLRGTGE
jgi:deoxyribodipyrimidine photo-lyase